MAAPWPDNSSYIARYVFMWEELNKQHRRPPFSLCDFMLQNDAAGFSVRLSPETLNY